MRAATTFALALLSAFAFHVHAATAYVLGPGDRISVTLRDLKEIEFQPTSLAPDGTVEFQYAGRLQAGGLTTEQLAREIETRLQSVVRNPKVVVEITEYGSQPVSVLGSVHKPGLHQLRGGKTLLEVLSMAEGLTTEAGNTILVTRPISSGPIPLAIATTDSAGNFSVASIGLKKLLDGSNPEGNILIRPNDVISVPRSELIYVVGNVRKPGGFTLLERESVSALQALALAEGMDSTAAPEHARILRPIEDGKQRKEIVLDLRKILSNQAPDQMLQPNDILFIPNSAIKSASRRAMEVGIQMATGVVIFRR
ncbi:MAG: polysaccharide biosynthesis/export family protein [Acidobacteriota bacterium]